MKELKNLTTESKKLITMDPWDITKELHPDINEATILNISDEDRLNYFKDAYQEIANRLEKLRINSNDSAVIVPMHSVFYWRSRYKDAIRDEFLEWLSPDFFITIIHNMKAVKVNLDEDPHSRFSDITFPEILHWRQREIQRTSRWAKMFKKEHVVIARNEPVEVLHRVLFTEKKKIYFSYPMSYVSDREMNNARKLIKKLRGMGYIIFDPSSIDDAQYVSELHGQLKAKKGIVTKQELPHVARVVGDHTVDVDYKLIEQSDMVVVRYPSVEYNKFIVEKDKVAPAIYVPLSAGVICEMVKGYSDGKKVFAVWLPKGVEPSPFFRYHCTKWFIAEPELLDYLKQKEPPG